MKIRVKLTKAKIESLKHPIGKHPSKHFDLLCEGHAVFVMPQPSLKKAHYAHWSTLTYDTAGKQKRSGRLNSYVLVKTKKESVKEMLTGIRSL